VVIQSSDLHAFSHITKNVQFTEDFGGIYNKYLVGSWCKQQQHLCKHLISDQTDAGRHAI